MPVNPNTVPPTHQRHRPRQLFLPYYHSKYDYEYVAPRYKGSINTLILLAGIIQYVVLFVPAFMPVMQWLDGVSNQTVLAWQNDRAHHLSIVGSSIIMMLHYMAYIHSQSMYMCAKPVGRSVFERICLLEQLTVLGFAVSLLFAWKDDYVAAHCLFWPAIILWHLRQFDLARHWLQKKTFVPIILQKPYIINRLCCRDGRYPELTHKPAKNA